MRSERMMSCDDRAGPLLIQHQVLQRQRGRALDRLEHGARVQDVASGTEQSVPLSELKGLALGQCAAA